MNVGSSSPGDRQTFSTAPEPRSGSLHPSTRNEANRYPYVPAARPETSGGMAFLSSLVNRPYLTYSCEDGWREPLEVRP